MHKYLGTDTDFGSGELLMHSDYSRMRVQGTLKLLYLIQHCPFILQLWCDLGAYSKPRGAFAAQGLSPNVSAGCGSLH